MQTDLGESVRMSTQNELPSPVEQALQARDPQAALDASIEAFGCQAGTVHWLDAQSGMLKLAASRNIPEAITQIVATVPIGKGDRTHLFEPQGELVRVVGLCV